MIVIVIMGVIYTLSVTSFNQQKEINDSVTLKNLKTFLTDLEYEKSVKLLCLDECESCDIFIDGEKDSTLEGLLDSSVKVYRYDYYLGLQEIMKDVYFNKENRQENVCFSYKIDKKGVGDQVLVEYREKVYDFSTYLSGTQVYNSTEDAVDAKAKLIEEVAR